jgi:hypothetical protein
MAQRTFCDKCGSQCTHYVLNLYGTVNHTTGQGESVGQDDLKPVQFCKTCADPLIEQFGLVLVQGYREDVMPEPSVAIPVARSRP